MLKKFILTALLAIVLIACGAATSNTEGTATDSTVQYGKIAKSSSIALPEFMFPGPLDPVWGEDEVMLLAIANLGDFSSLSQLQSSPFYPLFKSLYPDIENIKKISVDTGSGELWYIEPLVESMSVAINEYSMEMFNGEKDENDGRVLFRTEKAKPMLIRMCADDPGSVIINAVDNEGHRMTWIPTMTPHDNVLRVPDEVTDFTYHPIDWLAELGRDYICDMGNKKVRLCFYGNGILAINGELGEYMSYHTTHNEAIALYYCDAQGREGTALVTKWEQDDRAFNMSNYSGYDLGLGKLATFLPYQ